MKVHAHATTAKNAATVSKINSCCREKPSGLTSCVGSALFPVISLKRVDTVAAAGYQPESRDDMSRHEVLGVRRVRKDRRTEDEREDCDRVGHDRQEVFGESRVGSDDLPDDRHCGRVQGQTDRAEKKDDRTSSPQK